MPRLVWLTDIHLNFCSQRQVAAFIEEVRRARPDAVLAGGDTGEAKTVAGYLELMAERLGVPVYFVLGNHDFYGGSIKGVEDRIRDACRKAQGLHWLEEGAVVPLADGTALVGVGGWADGALGDYDGSDVELNDYYLIRELTDLSKPMRLAGMRLLAERAAERVRRSLSAALGQAQSVVLLTHVPPFRAACWHEGGISAEDWLPFFTCKEVGDALAETMSRNRDKHLRVLCGHTHSEGQAEILPNLTVLTGHAVYGRPEVQMVFEAAGAKAM